MALKYVENERLSLQWQDVPTVMCTFCSCNNSDGGLVSFEHSITKLTLFFLGFFFLFFFVINKVPSMIRAT